MFRITKKHKQRLEPDLYLHKNEKDWVKRNSKNVGRFNDVEFWNITSNFIDGNYWYLKTL